MRKGQHNWGRIHEEYHLGRLIWAGEEGISDVSSSMNKDPEVQMSMACGKLSEGMAVAGAEHNPWTGTGAKAREGYWVLLRFSPRALIGFST